MNYADEDIPFARILEFRHLHPERDDPADRAVIAREFSRFARRGDEPYCPIETAADKEMLRRYQARAAARAPTSISAAGWGRLAIGICARRLGRR